jgi:hypothetical protein
LETSWWFHQFHNSRVASPSQGKGKKRGENKGENLRDANTAKLEAKMKRKKTKRKQRGCDVAKVIDTVEQAVSTAKKVYRVIEPVVNAFTNRPKTK